MGDEQGQQEPRKHEGIPHHYEGGICMLCYPFAQPVPAAQGKQEPRKDETEMTEAELDAELRANGIDPDALNQRALEVVERIRNEGVESVRYTRCMEHRDVPQLNQRAGSGAECPVCAFLGHVSPDWDKGLGVTHPPSVPPQSGERNTCHATPPGLPIPLCGDPDCRHYPSQHLRGGPCTVENNRFIEGNPCKCVGWLVGSEPPAPSAPPESGEMHGLNTHRWALKPGWKQVYECEACGITDLDDRQWQTCSAALKAGQ